MDQVTVTVTVTVVLDIIMDMYMGMEIMGMEARKEVDKTIPDPIIIPVAKREVGAEDL